MSDPGLAHIACPIQCQCGAKLFTTGELTEHFRYTGHPFYQPMNGGYT